MVADVAGVRLDARDERGLEVHGRLLAPHVRDAGAQHADRAVGMAGCGFGEEQTGFHAGALLGRRCGGNGARRLPQMERGLHHEERIEPGEDVVGDDAPSAG